MNRVYKVIWSKVRHCYVVVSELTRRQGKSNAKSVCIRASAAAVLAAAALTGTLLTGPVWAAEATQQPKAVQAETKADDAKKADTEQTAAEELLLKAGSVAATSTGEPSKDENNNLAWGSGAGVTGGTAENPTKNSVAIGTNAAVHTDNSVAIGNGASIAQFDNGEGNNVAIGNMAGTTGQDAAAIGSNANAAGDHAVAFGGNASATEGSTALGGHTTANHTSIAIGSYDTDGTSNTSATGKHAVAIGYQTSANAAENALAIGTSANVSSNDGIAIGAHAQNVAGGVDGGVALGSYSAVDTDRTVGSNYNNSYVGYDPATGQATTNTSPVWKATKGAVSVGAWGDGNAEITRQITHVAAGTKDSDAVNVAQLKSLHDAMENAGKLAHDYSLIANPEENSNGKYTVDANGDVTLKVKDSVSGDTKDVTISGIGTGSGEGGAWNLTTNGDTAKKTTIGKDSTVDMSGAKDTVKVDKNGNPTTETGDEHQNITVTKTDKADGTGTDVSYQLNDVLHVGTSKDANTITIDGQQGEITGLTNRTWTQYDYSNSVDGKPVNIYADSGKAVTEAQLRQALENLPEQIQITEGRGNWGGKPVKPAGAVIHDVSNRSIAMGNGAVIYGGTTNKENASDNIAMGGYATISKDHESEYDYEAEGNVVIGSYASAVGKNQGNIGYSYSYDTNRATYYDKPDHDIDEATVIGMGAKSEMSYSTALGAHSLVSREDYIEKGDEGVVNGIKDDATVDGTMGVVSVGNSRGYKDLPDPSRHNQTDSYTRRIINVSRGQINEKSTDAINGSQLYRAVSSSIQYDRTDPNDNNILPLKPEDIDKTSITLNKGGEATTIHNVHAGTKDTDAVNVSQMKTYTSTNDMSLQNGTADVSGLTVKDTVNGKTSDTVVSKGYKADDKGNVIMQVKDQNKDGQENIRNVVITDAASKAQQDKNTTNIKTNTDNITNVQNTLKGAVMYKEDTSKEGGYDKNYVELGGDTYTTQDGNHNGGTKITNVAYAQDSEGSAAVNVDKLKDYVAANGGGSWNLTANGADSKEIKKGNTVDFTGANGVKVSKEDSDTGAKVTVGLDNKITLGEAGKDGADGKDGSITIIHDNKETTITLNGKDGEPGVDGKDGITRIEYADKDGGKQEVATLNDGLKFKGDINDAQGVKLNKQVNIVGGQTDSTQLSDGKNIGVVTGKVGDDGNLQLDVKLAKELTGLTSVTIGGAIDGKPGTSAVIINNNGINAGGKVITNAGTTTGTNVNDVVNVEYLNQKLQGFNGDDFHLVNGTEELKPAEGNNKAVTGYKVKEDGTVELTVQNGDDTASAKKVTIGGIASKASVDELNDFAVKYDKNTDGTVNKNSVTLGGDTYSHTVNKDGSVTTDGGTKITNVAYADITKAENGSQAVNVDLLKDQIKEAGTTAANADFYLKNGNESLGKDVSYGEGASKVTTGYKADDKGNIDMIVTNENNETKHVVLTDVASKAKQDENTTNITNLGEQLKGAVMYNTKEENGKTVVDKSGVKLGGDPYENVLDENGKVTGHTGGTHMTNVAYADGNEGSAAVNVDKLKDYVAANGGWNLAVSDKDGNTHGSQNIKPGATLTMKSTDNNIVVGAKPQVDDKGNVTVGVALNNRIVLGDETTDNTIALDSTTGQGNIGGVVIGQQTVKGNGKDAADETGKYVTGLTNTTWKQDNIVSGRAATEDQLKSAVNTINSDVSQKTFGLSDDKGNKVTNTLDNTVSVKGADGITSTVVDDGQGNKHLEIGLGDTLTVGSGKDGKDGKDGSITIVNKDGTQGTIGINGKDGKDGVTRIIYTTKDDNGNDVKHEVATLDDGLKFKGDDNTVIAKKLNEQLDIKGGADSAKLTDGNIGVVSDNGALHVQLAKDIKGLDSLNIGGTVDKDGTITGGINISKDGIDAGGKVITNAGTTEGTNLKDVVNVEYLNNQLKDKSSTDFQLINGTETIKGTTGKEDEVKGYKVNDDGTVSMIVRNGEDEETQKTVSIGNIAAKSYVDGLDKLNVKYDNESKNSVTLHTEYNAADKKGGTTITNVAYAEINKTNADGTDNPKYNGSAAVNVDLLKDQIAEAGNTAAKADFYLKNGNESLGKDVSYGEGEAKVTTGYKADDKGNIDMTVTNEKGDTKHVVLTDIASKKQQDENTTNITNNTNKINDLDAGAVKYRYDETNKTYNKDFVDLGGKAYEDVKNDAGQVTGHTGGTTITNVAYANINDAKSGSQAVNVDLLKDTVKKTNEDIVSKGLTFAANSGTPYKAALGSTVTIKGEGTKEDSKYSGENIKTVVDSEGNLIVKMDKDLKGNSVTVGEKGADGKDGADGSITIINKNGTQGTIGINGKNGKDGLDGTSITRIEYADKEGNKQEVATMNDGLRFAGDNYVKGDTSTVAYRKLNEKLDITGGADKDKLTDNNIGVIASDKGLEVKLAKDVKGLESLTIGGDADGKGAVIINNDGINAGGKVITNAGTSTATSGTDVVNIDYLNGKLDKNNEELVNKGFGIGAEIGGDVKKKLGETISIVGDKNVNTSVVDGKIQIALENRVVLGDESTDQKIVLNGNEGRANIGGVVIGNQNGGNYVTSLDNKTWNGTDYVSGRGATEDQLKALQEALNKQDAGNVKYHVNDDGTVDYTSIVLGGGDNYEAYTSEGHNGGTHITNVAYATGSNGGEAVNVDYLKDQIANVKTETANKELHIKEGQYTVGAVKENTITMQLADGNGELTGKTVELKDVAKASDVGNVSELDPSLQNKDGSKTTVVNAVNNLNNKVGDLNYSKVEGTEIADGDNTTTAIGKLDNKIDDIGNKVEQAEKNHTTVAGGNGITVTDKGTDTKHEYEVSISNDFTLNGTDDKGQTNGNSIHVDANKGQLTVTGKNGETTNNVVIDGQKGTVSGLTNTTWDSKLVDKDAADGGYKGSTNAATESQLQQAMAGAVQYDRDDKGNVTNQITLNKGGDAVTITNVADGKVEAGSKDAVNGGQLYNVQQQVEGNSTAITNVARGLSNLDGRVDKVGAGAAALAALHPLDFDPDDKWDFAAGYGNYRSASAVAMGAYYRPNEDTMFSLGGTFGNGENMVNAGVSFKLGQGNNISTSRVAMAKEIKDLRNELEAMKKAMVEVHSGKQLDTSKLQLFPDVPKNHWAYEYIAVLAGNGLIQGYPDGTFDGGRTMTRYEFAAMLYRAMQQGAVLSDKILTEFAPELERFRIDTIARDKDGNPTIERVRVNK